MNIEWKDIGLGWKNRFKPIVDTTSSVIEGSEIVSIEKFYGMLRIKFTHLDKDIRVLLDSIAYKIERDSAKTCEKCGKSGTRRKDIPYSSEIKCLCWACYALEMSSLDDHNKSIS